MRASIDEKNDGLWDHFTATLATYAVIGESPDWHPMVPWRHTQQADGFLVGERLP